MASYLGIEWVGIRETTFLKCQFTMSMNEQNNRHDSRGCILCALQKPQSSLNHRWLLLWISFLLRGFWRLLKSHQGAMDEVCHRDIIMPLPGKINSCNGIWRLQWPPKLTYCLQVNSGYNADKERSNLAQPAIHNHIILHFLELPLLSGMCCQEVFTYFLFFFYIIEVISSSTKNEFLLFDAFNLNTNTTP